MFCNRCGHDNKDGANFCSKCGERLEKRKTINLKKDIINENDYESFNENNYENFKNNYNNNKGYLTDSKKIINILVGILVLGLIAFVAKEVILDNDDLKSEKVISYSSEEEDTTSNFENDNYEYEQDYILPYSSDRILTYSDVKDFSKTEIKYARNEIYARNGRLFNNKELQRYFNNKSWYDGYIEPEYFNEDYMLTEVEYRNVKFLLEVEDSM